MAQKTASPSLLSSETGMFDTGAIIMLKTCWVRNAGGVSGKLAHCSAFAYRLLVPLTPCLRTPQGWCWG
jgi:hypothetical protein